MTARALGANTQIVWRTCAALFGGYIFAVSCSGIVAWLLPFDRIDSVLTALMASIALYVLAFIWAFAGRTFVQAWLVLLLPTAPFGLIVLSAL